MYSVLRQPDRAVGVQLERLRARYTALIAGISVRARLGVSSPPGSLMYSASISGQAASLRAAAT